MGVAIVSGKPGIAGKRVLMEEDFTLEITEKAPYQTLTVYFPEGITWREMESFVYTGRHYINSAYRACNIVKRGGNQGTMISGSNSWISHTVPEDATSMVICVGSSYITTYAIFATLK